MNKIFNITGPQIAVVSGYSFIGEIKGVVFELRWMIAFIAVLIFADFALGLIDSIAKRGEDFRFSRAGRRTMCKFIEYNSYLVVGFMLGIAVLQPVGICNYTTSSICGLILAILFEADSVKDHICAIHDVENKISIKKLIVAYLKRKYAPANDAINAATASEKSKLGNNKTN